MENSIDSVRSELSCLSRLMEKGAMEDNTGPQNILGPHPSVVERTSAAAISTDSPEGEAMNIKFGGMVLGQGDRQTIYRTMVCIHPSSPVITLHIWCRTVGGRPFLIQCHMWWG